MWSFLWSFLADQREVERLSAEAAHNRVRIEQRRAAKSLSSSIRLDITSLGNSTHLVLIHHNQYIVCGGRAPWKEGVVLLFVADRFSYVARMKRFLEYNMDFAKRHDATLAVKVGLSDKSTNQPPQSSHFNKISGILDWIRNGNSVVFADMDMCLRRLPKSPPPFELTFYEGTVVPSRSRLIYARPTVLVHEFMMNWLISGWGLKDQFIMYLTLMRVYERHGCNTDALSKNLTELSIAAKQSNASYSANYMKARVMVETYSTKLRCSVRPSVGISKEHYAELYSHVNSGDKVKGWQTGNRACAHV